MADEGRIVLLERGVAEHVVGMHVGVDHVADRLVGHGANRGSELAAGDRAAERVDDGDRHRSPPRSSHWPCRRDFPATAARSAPDARTRRARSRSPRAPRPPPPARNAAAETPRARELPAGSPAARSGTGRSTGRGVQISSLAPFGPRMRRSWGSGNAEPRLAFFIHAGVVRGAI